MKDFSWIFTILAIVSLVFFVQYIPMNIDISKLSETAYIALGATFFFITTIILGIAVTLSERDKNG